jgi:hypothetical protein
MTGRTSTIRSEMTEAKVDHSGPVFACEEDVRSLEILVTDAELMQGMDMDAEMAHESDQSGECPVILG